MIIAIHQPHYLPWLGYLHRMAQVDAFVLLDHVQFERRNYQNRTMVRMNDEARWLTVPVIQHSQKERIVDKRVDNDDPRPWGTTHYSTLRHAYREAEHFKTYADTLRGILEARWERLVDLNRATLDFMREAFEIRTPLVRSSELDVDGQRGELVFEICKALGADRLLAGMGGSRGYLNVEEFARRGVRIEWHQFQHPVYAQPGPQPFVPGLSAVDMLFHCGPGMLLPAAERKAA